MHFGLQKTLRLIVKNSTPRTLLLRLIHLHAFDFLKVLHTALSIVFSVKLIPAYLIADSIQSWDLQIYIEDLLDMIMCIIHRCQQRMLLSCWC